MATPVRHLVVCGGNGFLGSRICKHALSRGWTVTSISRSGAPHWQSLFQTPTPPDWSQSPQMTWHRANILHPSDYTHILSTATAVVHTMGILLEVDYKGVLTGKEPIISGLKKAFSQAPPADTPLTYETMNRDSALLLANEAGQYNVPTFLYVSAADGFPLMPSRYISTKREAERRLEQEHPDMRIISIRPAFMYDSTRPVSVPLAFATGITSSVNSLFGGKLPLLGAAGYKPSKVDDVAMAAMQAIEDEEVSGVLDVAGLERLATKAWRAGML